MEENKKWTVVGTVIWLDDGNMPPLKRPYLYVKKDEMYTILEGERFKDLSAFEAFDNRVAKIETGNCSKEFGYIVADSICDFSE